MKHDWPEENKNLEKLPPCKWLKSLLWHTSHQGGCLHRSLGVYFCFGSALNKLLLCFLCTYCGSNKLCLLYKLSLCNSFSKDEDWDPLTCQHQYIHTIEHYSALKRKEILKNANTWMNIEDMMLSGISQSQRGRYCISFIHMRHLEWPESETESRMGLPGSGERWEWGVSV